MRVLQINCVSGIRSTGRICAGIADMLQKNGHESRIVYGRVRAGRGSEDISLKIGNLATNVLHYLTYMLFDDDGKGSWLLTKGLIRKIRKYRPDIIHLHNIHGHYINYNVLMDYIAKEKLPAVFSLHDCWQFTGNCYHFDYVGCDKWKTGCGSCPVQDKYPLDRYWIDRSAANFRNKKAHMDRIQNKVFLPASHWLEGLVRESFLAGSRITTIHPGLDLTQFCPRESDIKERYALDNRPVVLCVASTWSWAKGQNYLPQVADGIQDAATLVVVGALQDEQIKKHPNILHISQTDSIEELARWYSAAEVYLNLTLQETFGLTNVEALACGTPVVTFDAGGCSECVDESCGITVPRDDVDAAVEAVKLVLQTHPFSPAACCEKARQFEQEKGYLQYLEVYHSIMAMKN